jgi:NhaP-type Na+/H+ or K+/H+ antiporter
MTIEVLWMVWSGFVFLMLGYMAKTEDELRVKTVATLLMMVCAFVFGFALHSHIVN